MLLSIIVPLYNSASYMPRCLDSLLHQDIPLADYEIILVNDGSPDNSLSIAKDYASKYSNIIVFSQENTGTSGARNTGLSHARGKYVSFVDPDDYVLENSYRVIIERMEEASLDVLRFGYVEVDEQYAPTRSCKHPETPDYSSKIMDGCSFMQERLGTACYVWTFLFRTSLLKDNSIFFDVNAYIDDTPWLPQVLMVAERVDSIDFKRYFYLIRSGSLVRAGGEKGIKKKMAAQKWLIAELQHQKTRICNDKAEEWYSRMISHSVVSLLSLVGSNDYARRKDVIAWLKKQDALPITSSSMTRSNRYKVKCINISPRLFCDIIHIKHR
jgi:glycosyltransferase involved in cell wall biosynthesis